jgi:hypothetical protein
VPKSRSSWTGVPSVCSFSAERSTVQSSGAPSHSSTTRRSGRCSRITTGIGVSVRRWTAFILPSKFLLIA